MYVRIFICSLSCALASVQVLKATESDIISFSVGVVSGLAAFHIIGYLSNRRKP